MSEEHEIIRLVRKAQGDSQAADELIHKYLPFIKSETAKFLKRPPIEGRDDELCIAMLAFYEAVMAYRVGKGAFFSFAAVGIRNRLIDYYRREQRHLGVASLESPVGNDEDGRTLLEQIDSGRNEMEELTDQLVAKAEIQKFAEQLKEFGLSMTDVAECCPKQQRTLDACLQALEYAKGCPQLLEKLVQSRKLPITQLAEGAGVERKTLERHRKYMVAILLAYTNGYEIIRGHLCQIKQKGGRKI